MQVFDLKAETLRRLAGRNLYLPHPLMVNSGTFWRCAHGTTGLDGNGNWEGCNSCQTEIIAYDAIGETVNPEPVAAALLIDGKYRDPFVLDGRPIQQPDGDLWKEPNVVKLYAAPLELSMQLKREREYGRLTMALRLKDVPQEDVDLAVEKLDAALQKEPTGELVLTHGPFKDIVAESRANIDNLVCITWQDDDCGSSFFEVLWEREKV